MVVSGSVVVGGVGIGEALLQAGPEGRVAQSFGDKEGFQEAQLEVREVFGRGDAAGSGFGGHEGVQGGGDGAALGVWGVVGHGVGWCWGCLASTAFHVKHMLGGLDLAPWHALVGIVGDGVGDVRSGAVSASDGCGVPAPGTDSGDDGTVTGDGAIVEGIV